MINKAFKRATYLLALAATTKFVGLAANEEPYNKLKKDLEKVIFHADPIAKIGIKVIQIKDGGVIYEKHADTKFIPTGAIKLVTAAAALETLGPSYCFETKLLTNGTASEGALKGNLYLQGSGDPSLKTTCLEDLIFQLKLMNIKEIDGDLIFDATEFDEITLAPGWMWDEKIEYRDCPVDALTINHSCVDVWVKPGQLITMSPMVFIKPEIPGIVIENEATMANIPINSSTLSVGRKDIIDKDVISISGMMSLKDDAKQFKIPVKNPYLFVATEFSEKLRKNDIKLKGKIRFESVPSGCEVIASHISEPLFKLVMHMLKASDNLYANCFFKKLGRVKFGKPGTWPNGSQAVRDFLNQINSQEFADLVILDGSGESRYDKMTPNQVVTLLRWIRKKFNFAPEYIASIPLAGIDYSLRKRLKEKSIHARVRAIEGSLKGVSSLHGYIRTRDNEPLAFSIMINGFIKNSKEIKTEIEDRVCSILANFTKKET